MHKTEEGSDADLAKELVGRIQAGDPEADKELVTRYQGGILYHLKRMSRDHALCEDLAQETLQLILLKIRDGQVQQPGALNSFIRNTAKNLYIAHFRKQQRRGDVALDPSHPDLCDPSEDPQQALERAQEVVSVHQVMGRLKSPRDRKVLFYFYIQEKDKATICRELDINFPIFNGILCRARARFRALWDRFEKDNSLEGNP